MNRRLTPGGPRIALPFAVCLGLALCAALAEAQVRTTDLLNARDALFCETPAAFDDRDCVWRPVTLPHRWSPAGPGMSWALYRFDLPDPGTGAHAVIAAGISLDARLRIDGTPIGPDPAAVASAEHPRTVRYWPQWQPFWRSDDRGSSTMQLDVALQGHRDAKNGIGLIGVGTQEAARHWHWRETLIDVTAVMALAAGTFIAAVFGAFAGESRTQAGRLLQVLALLAGVAAVRTASTFVITPPVGMTAWTTLNLWALALIAILACTTIGVYLSRSIRLPVFTTVGALTAVSLILWVVPGASIHRAAELIFTALAMAGLGLLIALVSRVWRSRDSLGTLLAGSLLALLVTGVHDLMLHLDRGIHTDRYLQKWSTLALLIVMITLLARRVATQGTLELALQRERARRDELLRDLHDGVGSRLVALAFHARHAQSGASALVDEINALMFEVQMIQQAVRTGPTSLDSLLADLRHLYSRVGGGRLPVHWDIVEPVSAVPLSAEQSVATLRIIEEGITNALKHAQPSRVIIRLRTQADDRTMPHAAVLSVIDDGIGAFQPGVQGGLSNIQFRAARAGLHLTLGMAAEGKALSLLFPLTQRSSRAGRAWRRLRGTASSFRP
jgi:signal transduction histidine kinase